MQPSEKNNDSVNHPSRNDGGCYTPSSLVSLYDSCRTNIEQKGYVVDNGTDNNIIEHFSHR
jgi:hypothetical protein